jgi:hypothetical protein
MANELAGMTVADPSVPAPAPAEMAPAELEIPSPLADVVAGSIPGVTLPPIEGQPTPLQEFVVANFQRLNESGLEYFELPDLSSVVYNPDVITEADLPAAAEDGSLAQITPLAADFGPIAAPAPAAGAPPAAVAAPPQASGALSGARVAPDRKLETARLKNAAPAPRAAPNPVVGQLAKRAI